MGKKAKEILGAGEKIFFRSYRNCCSFSATVVWCNAPPPPPRDALEGKGPQRRPQKRFDWRLEEVAKAVGGGYCRLRMPLKPALGVREPVAGHGLGALEGGGTSPASNASLPPPPPAPWGGLL